MQRFKDILLYVGWGVFLSVVVHGWVVVMTKVTVGVWPTHSAVESTVFLFSVAMFSSLVGIFDIVSKKATGIGVFRHMGTRSYVAIAAIVLTSVVWIAYGFMQLGTMSLRVIPERQPLFVRMSDNSIQNKYVLKIVNKTDQDMHVTVSAVGGVTGQTIIGAERPLLIHRGKLTSYTIFIKAPEASIQQEVTPIVIAVGNVDDPAIQAEYKTVFNGPKR